MGVGTVMDAGEVIIIVSGLNKARALHIVVEGGMIMCDEESTVELQVSTVRYFKDIERDALSTLSAL